MLETEVERSPRRLGGIAMTPMRPAQPPSHLDRRGEGRLEHRLVEADEADESRDARHLDRPEAEAAALEFLLDPAHEGSAVGPGAHSVEEMLHHDRVGIDRRERIEIGVSPAAQQEPLRTEFRLASHSLIRLASSEKSLYAEQQQQPACDQGKDHRLTPETRFG